jgi:hypothetical protein
MKISRNKTTHITLSKTEYIECAIEWNKKQTDDDNMYDIDEVSAWHRSSITISENNIGVTKNGFVMFPEHFYELIKTPNTTLPRKKCKRAPRYKVLLLAAQLFLPDDFEHELKIDMPQELDGKHLTFITYPNGTCNVIDENGEVHVTYEEDGYASYISDWAEQPYEILSAYPLYDGKEQQRPEIFIVE